MQVKHYVDYDRFACWKGEATNHPIASASSPSSAVRSMTFATLRMCCKGFHTCFQSLESVQYNSCCMLDQVYIYTLYSIWLGHHHVTFSQQGLVSVRKVKTCTVKGWSVHCRDVLLHRFDGTLASLFILL